MDARGDLAKIEKEIDVSIKKDVHSAQPHVIAVTKYVTIERAREAYRVGIKRFGESRLDGFKEKKESLPNDVKLHFTDSLQSRKVKDIINEVDYFHALDRLSLAKKINKKANHIIKYFLQINVSGEESKHGIALEEVNQFINQIREYENIQIVGLITMVPLADGLSYIRNLFKELRHKRNKVQQFSLAHIPCTELSMEMSNDYQMAVEESATFVRVGAKLIGE